MSRTALTASPSAANATRFSAPSPKAFAGLSILRFQPPVLWAVRSANAAPCGVSRQAIRKLTGTDITLDEALILIDSGESGVLCDVVDIERLLSHGLTSAE